MIVTKVKPTLQETLTRLGALDQFLVAELGALEEGWFRADESIGKCTICVLRSDEERDQRLLDYMARKYSQELTV